MEPEPPAWRCFVAPAAVLIVAASVFRVLAHDASPIFMGRFAFVVTFAAPGAGLLLALYDTLTRRGSRLLPVLGLPVFGVWLLLGAVISIGASMQYGSFDASLRAEGADLIAHYNRQRKDIVAQAPRPLWGERAAAPAPASAPSLSPVPIELVPTQIIRLQDPVNEALTAHNSSPSAQTRQRLADSLLGFYQRLPGQSLQELDFITVQVYDGLDKLDDPAVYVSLERELNARRASAESAHSRAVFLGAKGLLELNLAAIQLRRAHRETSSFDAVFPRWGAAAALWSAGRQNWQDFLAAAQALGPLPADEAKAVVHLKDQAIYGLGDERDRARLERAVQRARTDKAFVAVMRQAFQVQAPGGADLARLKAAVAAAPDVDAGQLALAEALSYDRAQAAESAAAASRAVALTSAGRGYGAEPEGRALARGYGLLAQAQHALAQDDLARRSAEEALKLDPEDYRAQRVRGELVAAQSLAH